MKEGKYKRETIKKKQQQDQEAEDQAGKKTL